MRFLRHDLHSLAAPYALDALGAQTQGMIGYWLARALRGAAPGKQQGSNEPLCSHRYRSISLIAT